MPTTTPERPRALARYPNAAWDGRCWRDGAYWFDEAVADKAAGFFPKHLRLTKGEWAGRPFELEGWQEHDIIRPLFGWKRADGTRRYRRCFLWVARKNGKTELAAGISLLMLLGDNEPGAEVYSIASEGAQAQIVFDKAAAMVAYSPTLTQLIDCLKTALFCSQINGSFRPLSGKPQGKHGLNMSGLIGDEIHEWRGPDLYTFVHDSSVSRRQPLEVLISTAGVKGTHGEEIWAECEAILNGDIDDPETLVVAYAAGQDDDWTKPETWAKANPNLGVSVKLDSLEAECRRAQQLPRLENDFRRYKLNQWTEQAVRWLPMDAVDDDGRRFGWDHCVGATPWRAKDGTFPLEARLSGLRCFGGLDLSSVNDLSALVWWFPIQPGLDRPVMLPRFFKPLALLKEHSRRDRLKYEDWARQGALIATPGNVVDYEFIRAQILKDGEQFEIAHAGNLAAVPEGEGSIAIDRWNAIETTVKLRAEGLAAVLFGQGMASMSAPSKELERLVLAGGFDHGGHPVLRQHAKVCAVEGDAAGNIKPSKEGSSQRIDGVVAGVMALGIAVKDSGPKVSVYETRGVRRV